MNELIPLLQGLIGVNNADVVAFVTDWAGPLGWWIVLQLTFIFGGWQRGVLLAALASVAMFTNTWLKWLIAEPRPFLVEDSITAFRTTEGFGMPSGHAQGAVAIWGGLAWILRSKPLLVGAMVLLIFATGASRVYMGVHSPAQVLVGWLVGGLFLWLMLRWWPAISNWFAGLTILQICISVVVGAAVALAISQMVLFAMADFVAPQLWLDSYARLNPDQDGADMTVGLYRNILPLLVCLSAGFLSIGVVGRSLNLELPRTGLRWVTFTLALVVNLLFLTVLGGVRDSELGLLVAAFAQPVVCVLLPMLAVRAYAAR